VCSVWCSGLSSNSARVELWGEKEATDTVEIQNTLLFLFEPWLAVILKNVNLEQMVVTHSLLFFLFFHKSTVTLAFIVAWITSIKEKEIYNLYYTVLWTKYKSITLCYIYIIIFLDFQVEMVS